MFLKSMEIFGFKSFADRMPVAFESGITIVVGPNGCGKSNIVDSVKWVLGEKQARNIRGTKMEDVIFTGTEHRKPLSLAEVSLTLDNSNRVLELDSDSVTVTRRVFRDGESEYLINKSPVRLKDIEQLFLDTGIGKTSYSVLEQGRIDMILSSRAEDRRYIFEEAAGISRYKAQKKESLRKLQDTTDNLERINDIIHEIEREKDKKAKQADKTREYLRLRKEQKKYDLKHQALKYRDLIKRRNKQEELREKSAKESADISTRIASVSKENEQDEKRKNEIQLQLFELDKKMHTYKIKVEDIDDKTDKNRRLIENNRTRREKLLSEVEERSSSYQQLLDEKNRTIENGKQLDLRISEDRNQLKQYFERRKQKLEKIRSNRETMQLNVSDIADAERVLKNLREELEVVVKQLIDAIDKRKAELQSSENEREEVRGRMHDALKHVRYSLGEAHGCLNNHDIDGVRYHLDNMNIDSVAELVNRFEGFEDGFRSILFDKTGIHAQKESIDAKIAEKTTLIDDKRSENSSLEENNRTLQSELEDINEMINRIEKDLSRNDNEKNWIEKHVQNLDRQLEDIQKQIKNVHGEISNLENQTQQLQNEIQEWEERLKEFNDRTENLKSRIHDNSARRDELEKKMSERSQSSKEESEKLRQITVKIGDYEKRIIELDFKINAVLEYLWTEYEYKTDDIKKVKADELESNEISAEIAELKKKIQALGPINNLAIEEYNDLKKRFDYYTEQKADIEKARGDIVSVIEEINKTSVDLFMDTFKRIQKNFNDIFRQLFEGGSAEIVLTDLDNILESGIEITVRPPGKKPKTINLLSGGERSMTAIALLFSTYMVKPSPFCFLDEIDAALDEENVGRFLKMMRQFAQKTQFVIVTHNKKTMTIGSSIYGVTMEEPGVSKLISMKMESAQSTAL
jgi:chromosome segregation protein